MLLADEVVNHVDKITEQSSEGKKLCNIHSNSPYLNVEKKGTMCAYISFYLENLQELSRQLGKCDLMIP